MGLRFFSRPARNSQSPIVLFIVFAGLLATLKNYSVNGGLDGLTKAQPPILRDKESRKNSTLEQILWAGTFPISSLRTNRPISSMISTPLPEAVASKWDSVFFQNLVKIQHFKIILSPSIKAWSWYGLIGVRPPCPGIRLSLTTSRWALLGLVV